MLVECAKGLEMSLLVPSKGIKSVWVLSCSSGWFWSSSAEATLLSEITEQMSVLTVPEMANGLIPPR